MSELSGDMPKEAFLNVVGKGLGYAVAAPFKAMAGVAKMPLKAGVKAVKYPFGKFKNPTLQSIDKKVGTRGLAGGTLLSGAFAAPGIYSQSQRYGKGVASSYAKPSRGNLLTPINNKSPMGNIF